MIKDNIKPITGYLAHQSEDYSLCYSMRVSSGLII